MLGSWLKGFSTQHKGTEIQMSGTKILVIDDDATIRTLFQAAIPYFGYDVITAEDGVVGLEAYYEHSPDLVITDLLMPRKDGLEVISEIKSKNPDQTIFAIVAILGEMTERAREAGADEVIQKPFSITKLKEKIEQWLGA